MSDSSSLGSPLNRAPESPHYNYKAAGSPIQFQHSPQNVPYTQNMFQQYHTQPGVGETSPMAGNCFYYHFILCHVVSSRTISNIKKLVSRFVFVVNNRLLFVEVNHKFNSINACNKSGVII